jgi:voltage-gated potassium channel
MTASAPMARLHGNAYEIFILVVTILSLAVMAALLLPLDEATITALNFWDNLICCIFLADFAYNLTGSRPRRYYFVHQRGWLDLLGSIPSLGLFQYAALLRLARLSRLARILRILGGKHRKELVKDVLANRGQYALFITVLLALVVMSVSSVLILQFESRDPSASIKTGGDALWWSVVTITTVGYGDFYPVTTLGRFTAVFVMASGIGIIGALASILASILVTSAPAAEAEPAPPTPATELSAPATHAIGDELARTREELARARELMDRTQLELAALRGLLEAGARPHKPDAGPGSA